MEGGALSKRKLVWSALINGICNFGDVIETAVRELAERTKITHTHSKALLLTECAYSEFEPQGGERISAELASHTRLLAAIVTCADCLLFALVFLFPFTQKTALSSYNSIVNSLVFCVWEPCGCSTRMRGILLRSATQAK